MNLDEVKTQVATANRVLADIGLSTVATAALGQASMRVPSDTNKFVSRADSTPSTLWPRCGPKL